VYFLIEIVYYFCYNFFEKEVKLGCFPSVYMNYKDISLYDYELDESFIAQTPLEKRDNSKLLVVDKISGKICDTVFSDIISYLKDGDVLVLNNTKVLPSRIFGYKEDTHAKIEVLLLKDLGDDIWECLIRPQKRVRDGTIIVFDSSFKCEVTEVFADGITHIKLIYSGILNENLDRVGLMPLPPYIHEKLLDNDRYNTVYAMEYGSAAAPTAGLHFTNKLLDDIKKLGVEVLFVTLNVGLGTFRPVNENDISKHVMHSEFYTISEEVSDRLNLAKKEGRRIVCVGTTSLRTLESNITKYGKFISVSENTDIFIYPPYEFKSCDALITNFHLPKSTLVMLVSAFSSIDIIKNAYEYAKENNYRFFSFGDAMFLINMKGEK